MYSLEETPIKVEPGKILTLLPVVAALLNKHSTDNSCFNGLLAPSGKDRVFGGRPDKQAEVKKLAAQLNMLLESVTADLALHEKSLEDELPYLKLH